MQLILTCCSYCLYPLMLHGRQLWGSDSQPEWKARKPLLPAHIKSAHSSDFSIKLNSYQPKHVFQKFILVPWENMFGAKAPKSVCLL